MRALRILRSASEDIASAVRHYDARDPELGDAFLEGLNDTLERVRALPKSFATWPADPRFRGAPTKRFPYVVFFRELDETSIEVVAVAHTRRRPGYWR